MFTATFETLSELTYWVGHGWARSMLSLALIARLNPKLLSHVSIRLFLIPSRSSSAESRLSEVFKATDK